MKTSSLPLFYVLAVVCLVAAPASAQNSTLDFPMPPTDDLPQGRVERGAESELDALIRQKQARIDRDLADLKSRQLEFGELAGRLADARKQHRVVKYITVPAAVVSGLVALRGLKRMVWPGKSTLGPTAHAIRAALGAGAGLASVGVLRLSGERIDALEALVTHAQRVLADAELRLRAERAELELLRRSRATNAADQI